MLSYQLLSPSKEGYTMLMCVSLTHSTTQHNKKKWAKLFWLAFMSLWWQRSGLEALCFCLSVSPYHSHELDISATPRGDFVRFASLGLWDEVIRLLFAKIKVQSHGELMFYKCEKLEISTHVLPTFMWALGWGVRCSWPKVKGQGYSDLTTCVLDCWLWYVSHALRVFLQNWQQ